MGILNGKLFKKATRVMLDKANFTSECSLDSSLSTQDSKETLCEFASTVEEVENYEADISVPVTRFVPTTDLMRLKPEVGVDTYSSIKDVPTITKRPSLPDDQERVQTACMKQGIENLGINEVAIGPSKTCFSGIIYLPECEVVECHYLALYRLRLDTLSQYDFERWCQRMGHPETSKKYSQLVKVYANMKLNYFKDSFIINRIISRKNVHLKISDLFGEKPFQLRAFVVVGDRRTLILGVIDAYVFAVRGRLPGGVIKSADEYEQYVKMPNGSAGMRIRVEAVTGDCDRPHGLKGRCPRSRVTVARRERTVSSDMEETEAPPTCTATIGASYSERRRGPVTTSMRFKRSQVEEANPANAILCGGETFTVTSVIADETHAYILCKSVTRAPTCGPPNIDLSFLFDEDVNQSNSSSRMSALRRSLVAELLREGSGRRFYGPPLSEVPGKELYVVRCALEARGAPSDQEVEKLLARHVIHGKVVDGHQIGSESEVHLIGGTGDQMVACCKGLKALGLASDFQLLHP